VVLTKTTGLQVAVHARNSGTESGGELFKGSKDVASLLVSTQKKFFAWECRFFVNDIISGRFLGILAHFTWPWAQTVRW